MEREFVASVYIIDRGAVLLIYHKKLEKWLPPGGHVEKNETPPEAAIREAKEETGLEIELIPQENVWLHYWNAVSFERPYLCLLENIPAYKEREEHQHIDFVYLGKPKGESQISAENCRWFHFEELSQLKPDQEIFQETLDVLEHLKQCK